MTPDQPTWHPYDPGEPSDVAFENDCSLLVLLATPAAREAEWAERTAVSLARVWAEHGKRVFLVDLGLSRPRLHAAFGDANGEGMSDVLLYGASLTRIARAVPEGFLYAPTGTPVLDGAQALASPRWSLLADGFQRAGAQLVVFLPADEPGRDGMLSHARRIVVLAGSDGDGSLLTGVDPSRVTKVLSPPAGAAPEPTRINVSANGAAVEVEEVTALPLVRGMAPLSAAQLTPPEPELEDVSRRALAVGALALAALVVVLLIVLGILPIPGFSGP